MFTTPRKQKSNMIESKDFNNSPQHKSLININANCNSTPIPTTSSTTIVFENGTMFGNISNDTTTTTTPAKFSGTSTDNNMTTSATYLTIPEIVISASCSSNSLNRSRCEISPIANSEESAMESTALLESNTTAPSHANANDEPAVLQDEFEQFILNRTTSESNILESSIYSELQFPPSLHGGSIHGINMSSNGLSSGGGGGYMSSSGGPTATTTVTQMPGPQTPPNTRQTKRTKRKHKTKTKCTATAATLAAASQRASPTHYPPRYTAIFMDANQYQTQHHHHTAGVGVGVGGGAANALGQIASAAASSPFLNAPVATDTAAAAAYMQQFQYFQQRPMVTSMTPLNGHHRHHR